MRTTHPKSNGSQNGGPAGAPPPDLALRGGVGALTLDAQQIKDVAFQAKTDKASTSVTIAVRGWGMM